MRRLRQLALGILLLAGLSPGAALAQAYPYTLLWDDFFQPFSVGQPGDPAAKWYYGQAGWYVASDANASTWGYGLTATPPGIHVLTGEPTFTKTLPPKLGVPGQWDHMKWAAYMNNLQPNNVPGFEAVTGFELACDTWISGETYGTQFHPFGSSIVADPQSDLRLASFAMSTVDLESGLVFDFFFTNTMVYALYERLPYARSTWGDYAAFTYAIPVAKYDRNTWRHAKIAYERKANTVRWFLDDKQVFQISNPGKLIDRRYMILDHGGSEQVVSMNQLNCGMGMFTLLDAVRFKSFPEDFPTAPVRLNTTEPDFYFNPAYGQGSGTPWVSFFDPSSQDQYRLFGQGAQLNVYYYQVTNTQL